MLEIILVGLVLSADSFSAAVAMGMRPFTKKDALKFAFMSGAAEGLVALLGAEAGEHLISKIKAYDHWIAFTLLLAVSLHMAYEAIQDLRNKEKKEHENFHGILKILIVSFATSLDAFGVGIGLGIAKDSITPYIISIGFFAFISTIVGLYLAKKISKRFGPVISLIGALILIIIAFQMLKI